MEVTKTRKEQQRLGGPDLRPLHEAGKTEGLLRTEKGDSEKKKKKRRDLSPRYNKHIIGAAKSETERMGRREKHSNRQWLRVLRVKSRPESSGLRKHHQTKICTSTSVPRLAARKLQNTQDKDQSWKPSRKAHLLNDISSAARKDRR